ncbi:uncharacterized protein F4822DRAFT_276329 [Hypoxylon trugodes]|uniref:uncharacterized protein n=1 Tax=Hypoxylon trugodes TaxID=326681 RepID=UPI002193A37B|nr:uncharacterized protein F4822DRAFT_276329 [Hypoxylon trugodes]KAI1387199.1 hypothetical protein F4822DRAFT_276329 [Hypoxylon trugodes]
MMTSPRESATARLRQTLNPLRTTALGGFHNQLNTPHSAVSVTSSHTFAGHHTPASSIQPYNPQEWGQSPAVGHERTHQFPPSLSLRDSQASAPAPPPPYSPPRSQRPASIVYETPPANISAARIPASSVHRPSPEPSNTQSFPPPPGANGRGGSRERRFGLSSLTRRRDRGTPESISPPDPHPPAPLPRPQTLALQMPIPINPTENNPTSMPPNSRRAASASAIDTPTSARSRSASQSRWEPGMPLPPPPPGPPPPQSRSQSLSRTTEPIVSPPTRRPPPSGVTALGPVPPTPADWENNEREERSKSSNHLGLTIDTSSASESSSQAVPDSGSASTSAGSGLNRTGAVRGEKSLRERRNESRTRQKPEDGIQPLSDIIVPSGPGLSRRFSVHKGTPRSGGKSIADMPRSGDDTNFDSRNSTPRPSAGLHPETPTPPFSPHPQKAYPVTEPGHPIAPKALPTPPPQSRSASNSSQARPEIHKLMNNFSSINSSTYPTTKQAIVGQTAEQFCQGSIERFQAFANQEAVAESDAERVKLFTDFIVNESRLRRERYATAIGVMGSEILDLTRDLFRPMKARRDSTNSQTSEWTPQMPESRSQRNSLTSVFRDQAQSHSAPASANLPNSPINGPPPPPNANWTSQYMPSLSPILSMSVSEHLDESSSRGRPASRWWETESGGESNRIERTKRESKYMGVPKEAREALQWQDPPNSADSHAGPSRQYAENEYPPEKVGWHESKQNTPQPFRSSLLSLGSSTPNTPSPSHLDVSRLVTLPPPYPRHHPAVNNNHPELASTRTLVRALSDMREVQATKDRFIQDTQRARDEAAQASSSRQNALRTNLQHEISGGNMSYAEAAAIEADTQASENAKAKELEKHEFDRFQNAVVMPLNELLTGRIAQATSLFDELRSRLFVETQAPNPNMPQEEGDEQPELLEKLTLLKWIFEAREMLHREIYDLLTDRNDRYKEMVITPYRLSGNDEKLRTAEAFFVDDATKRRAAFANEVLYRTREFRSVVEENVERGVDMQLNAFWDLAPPLKRLLDKIPSVLDHGFRIQIPNAEFDENPSYHEHPLQYLFSLLLHAEKSTYQFIESQTNLLCLLHEIKEAVTSAQAKVGEAEGRDVRIVEKEREAEQTKLTDDLKEKVRVVQDQWEGALGEAMRSVKERVGEWLLSTGGWDESLEDGGVGGV